MVRRPCWPCWPCPFVSFQVSDSPQKQTASSHAALESPPPFAFSNFSPSFAPSRLLILPLSSHNTTLPILNFFLTHPLSRSRPEALLEAFASTRSPPDLCPYYRLAHQRSFTPCLPSRALPSLQVRSSVSPTSPPAAKTTPAAFTSPPFCPAPPQTCHGHCLGVTSARALPSPHYLPPSLQSSAFIVCAHSAIITHHQLQPLVKSVSRRCAFRSHRIASHRSASLALAQSHSSSEHVHVSVLELRVTGKREDHQRVGSYHRQSAKPELVCRKRLIGTASAFEASALRRRR